MQLIGKTKEKYSNEALIAGIKQKDRMILEYIYRQYFPMIIEFVGKNSGTKEDAKDIFHDGLTTIYEKSIREDISLQSSFKTYLYAICKNLWLMVLRRRKTASKIEAKEDFMTTVSSNIEEDIISQQRYKLYRHYFKTLGEDCQKVLTMFFEGISLREIATKMDFSEAYAKKKKFTCQKELISRIEKDKLYTELLVKS
ncbi:sigma-70 family RNA polymerase sigma factor [Fulvivirgaceae bacterium BMA12]|uniref:Sigma-70 family RNA polymerase sigma factor n=1 Tax=Agaribacillus aureus TaxID=3051825 RepID=A0ABT8L3E5_9BACT|nr:sigma-70 family RNA polymerase sigma factor [Fulvivirgaceae bacterium BMA12]